ncbi:unnamed protein product [Sphagnum jensenii]|uniref:Uncharacterized protein n=1 Tax=Sphagnum jensenii TaxID=128206 RepID=A0ABP1B4S7_9BRYO
MTNLEGGGLPKSLREGSGGESDLAVPATVLPSTTTVDMELSEVQSKGIDTSLHAFQGVREAPLATSKNVKIPFDYATGAQRGDVNMEAPISNDDLMHAGGFDARDDLDSMVPSAADGTDYEELLTEAMDYEDTGEADSYPDSRPGVGATDKQIHIRGGSMIAKSRSGKMEGL